MRGCWHVWQFTMPYPICISRNEPLTCKMWSNVIQWLTSPIHTFNTFNPLLIVVTYAWCFNSTLIHVLCYVISTTLSRMHENITFFHIKVKSYPIQELPFLLHSYVQIKYVMVNLMKFWQHFTLVSKYTKWNQSHELTMVKYEPEEQSNIH